MATTSADPSHSKGAATRERILSQALRLAGVVGLAGLTIGELATQLGLSKSGLFAHFKSKENLQLMVLDAAAEHFAARVFRPALKAPRGEPRIHALFENWLRWTSSRELPGGCIFLAGAAEWDDQEGPVRDRLVEWFEKLNQSLARAASIAVEEGHFPKDLDTAQFAYDLHAIVLKYHLQARLLRSPDALSRAGDAYHRLLAATRV